MSNAAKDPVWLLVSTGSHIRGDDDEKIRKDMEMYSQAKLNSAGRVLRFSSVVRESHCVPHRGEFKRVGDLLYVLVDHFDGVPATAMEERYFDSLEKVWLRHAHGGSYSNSEGFLRMHMEKFPKVLLREDGLIIYFINDNYVARTDDIIVTHYDHRWDVNGHLEILVDDPNPDSCPVDTACETPVEKPDSVKPNYKGCICGAIAGGGRCTDESCPAYIPWHIPNDGCLEHGLMMSELMMCKGDQHRGFCTPCRACVTCGMPDSGFEDIHMDNQLL